ncbi:MAG: hypothetical protein Q7S40_29605, partial [Opitutaceae bacterium]|nr:hypothetical protein [Opitutaceae bacterium]
LWIHPAMDTNDGMQVTVACLQPPDAENRTSGGVEGSRGAILATPSDLPSRHPASKRIHYSSARLGARASRPQGSSGCGFQPQMKAKVRSNTLRQMARPVGSY